MSHPHHGDLPANRHHVSHPALDTPDTGYGRMFPDLPAAYFLPGHLDAASNNMQMPPAHSEQAEQRWQTQQPAPATPAENETIAAAYTYFGQFIDHDITFDVTSRLDRSAADPEFAPNNFRTPRLDLDSVYKAGPHADPYLYDGDKFLLAGNDLPRTNGGVAIIGDPRNDENALVSQIHLAVMGLHNRLVDGGRSFDQAQQLTRWHYQWVVVNDFVVKVCGPDVLGELLLGGGLRLLPWPFGQFIPVEFSGAAFRFGHSQVRDTYVINEGGPARPIFSLSDEVDLRGGTPNTGDRVADWDLLTDPARTPGFKIDTNIVQALFHLFGHNDQAADTPGVPAGTNANLAARNLRRGVVLGLPSGEDILDQLIQRGIIDPAPYRQLGPNLDAAKAAIHAAFWADAVDDPPSETPLWGWLLAEAELVSQGERLGPVGARIVAETLLGLLQADPRSYLRRSPGWAPEPGTYELNHLLTHAASDTE